MRRSALSTSRSGGHLLGRLRREVARTADADLVRLYEEVRGYPCDGAAMEVDVPGPDDVVVPLRYRAGECELAFFSTVAAFGTPLDITVDELAIELFFPADPPTASVLALCVADDGALSINP